MIIKSNSTIDFTYDKSILGITNGGGGGHGMAMDSAHHQYTTQKNISEDAIHKLIKIDVIKGSFPPLINNVVHKLFTKGWNDAKRKGDINKQEYFIKGKALKKGPTNQRLADIFLFIPVFVATFFRLAFNRKITRIVDTQPLATGALIKAARLVNFLFRRNISVTKIMTDLPTTEAIHFSVPIKRLSKKDKKIFELVTTNPLIEKADAGLSEKEWWHKYFNLNLNLENPEKSEVKYRPFPLRPAFATWKNRPLKGSHPHIQVKINNSEEQECINDLLKMHLKKKTVNYGSDNKKKNVIHVPIKDEDFVGMITIGSQAAEGTQDYLEQFVDIIKDKVKTDDENTNYFLFVQSGKHEPNMQNSLFKNVYKKAKNAIIPEKLRNRINIIPMGFQDDDEFAPLFHRANFGIYSTGGLTTMEVNTIANGNIMLHSEKKLSAEDENKSLEELQTILLDGFSIWEKGNARYQQVKKGAKIVSPKIFKKTMESLGK
ncbi:MAG: hypothetical protein VX777_02930 [Chlamydiota bacterium]|nr:hypothetical protein [Chlamydiota bacterium]